IHRGDNGQIIIEDWCIGCGLCANQCPYGSIQMHDVGLIPEKCRGWRYQYAVEVAGDKWSQVNYNDRSWAIATAPFHYNQEFRTHLATAMPSKKIDVMKASPMMYFRFTFPLDSNILSGNSHFKLEVTSTDPEITLWINGREMVSEKPKGN